VPVVPVYIQEKIQPRVIIENLRRTAAAGEAEPELTLFDDFNGIAFEELVDFYQHDQNWANRLILGDSLLVMTSLAEKEGLKGKVQTIYLDPPYGIKFGSNWQVSTRKRDVKDGKGSDATRQPEQIKAFRDTWELGIHSYLAYLRDRFLVSRDLLSVTGSIFVQIGDENLHLVRSLLDEVFGSENFVSLITFKKTTGAGSFAGGTTVLASVADYILWYARDRDDVKYRQLYRPKGQAEGGAGQYTWIELPDRTRRPATQMELESVPDGCRLFSQNPLTSQTTREAQTTVFPVDFEGASYLPSTGGWKTNHGGMKRLALADRFIAIGKNLRYVRYLDDFAAYPFSNVWDGDLGVRRIEGVRGTDEHEGR
jgi:adenine-specific DNA-methyltransferase